MPGEFSDLENFSDLDNLLALAEEEFYVSESKEHTNDKTKDDFKAACENKTGEAGEKQSASKVSVIKSIYNSTSMKVQKSIAEFFKAPKRLPEEVAEAVEEIKKTKTTTTMKTTEKSFLLSSNSVAKSTATRSFKIPKFKLIPNTPFSVDAFSYGPIPSVTGYFLTHFHSDHYKGLSNKLFEDRRLRLYCSEVTGNLVKKELKVKEGVITTLKIGNVYFIEGIHVGVLDANQ